MQGTFFLAGNVMCLIILFCAEILINRMSNFTYFEKRKNEAFYQNQAI